MYQVTTFPVGAFQCNCSIVANAATREAIVVDPGDEADAILERVDAQGLRVTALWHTHAHLDHLGATATLLEELGRRNREAGAAAPSVYLHEGDRWLYENIAVQSSLLGLPTFGVPETFQPILDRQTYAGFDGISAVHTPGHTPGSCCLKVKAVDEIEAPRSFGRANIEKSSPFVLAGDTLFRRSVGRTDLWGGDSAQIVRSIKGRLLGLAPETIVVPGHGPLTTIAEEAELNPYVGKRA